MSNKTIGFRKAVIVQNLLKLKQVGVVVLKVDLINAGGAKQWNRMPNSIGARAVGVVDMDTQGMPDDKVEIIFDVSEMTHADAVADWLLGRTTMPVKLVALDILGCPKEAYIEEISKALVLSRNPTVWNLYEKPVIVKFKEVSNDR